MDGEVLKKSGKEISVKKASQLLNLSERTILNFIKQKKIEAIKVGRDWFIDYASFISFSEKYEFEIANLSENFGNIPKNSEKFVNVSENAETFPKRNNEVKLKNHLPSLRVYELAKNIIPLETINLKNPNPIDERIQSLIFSTLESIGSGFYAYSWDEKKFYYGKARSHAGGAMALMVVHESILNKWKKTNFELEEVLIPALGALIKTVEKKSLKEKSEGREQRGKNERT